MAWKVPVTAVGESLVEKACPLMGWVLISQAVASKLATGLSFEGKKEQAEEDLLRLCSPFRVRAILQPQEVPAPFLFGWSPKQVHIATN